MLYAFDYLYRYLPFFLRSLNRLIRAAKGVRYIGDHIVAVIDHPVVSVNDGVARVSILYPLRDDGVGCVIITRLRHIGEDTVDFDMLIPFAKFNQSRIRHAVKVALRADIERINVLFCDPKNVHDTIRYTSITYIKVKCSEDFFIVTLYLGKYAKISYYHYINRIRVIMIVWELFL